jgi:hypothetical protein
VLVTTTLTAPAGRDGVVAVIEEPLTTLTFGAAAPPNVTVAPGAKLVPVIVTDVPPLVVPEFGETADTVGAGAGGGVPDVVKRHTGPVAVWFAIVLPTIRQ